MDQQYTGMIFLGVRKLTRQTRVLRGTGARIVAPPSHSHPPPGSSREPTGARPGGCTKPIDATCVLAASYSTGCVTVSTA